MTPVGDIFQALAAPARRAILDELRDRDGQTLFEVCTRVTMKHGLNLTRQAISQHLTVLEEAGLVSTRQEGRYKLHFLHVEPLHTILDRWTGDVPEAQVGEDIAPAGMKRSQSSPENDSPQGSSPDAPGKERRPP